MHESYYFREEMAARERELQVRIDAATTGPLPASVAEKESETPAVLPVTAITVDAPAPIPTSREPAMVDPSPTLPLGAQEVVPVPQVAGKGTISSVATRTTERLPISAVSTIPFRIVEVPDDTMPLLPAMPSVPINTPRRTRRGLVLATISFLTMLVVALGALVVLQPTIYIGTVTTTVPAQTTNATPLPVGHTPQSVPLLSTQARNALNGCAAGHPKPYANTVFTGLYPTSTLPVPNEVALTFDDGPTPYSTPTILSFLEATHTPATFFVEGNFAAAWPGLVQREWNDGFAIGMHTWNHPELPLVPDAAMPHQFGDTLQAIHRAIGKDACIWLMRPPYGETNRRVLNVAMSYGLTTINWDDSSADWKRYGAPTIASFVLTHIHPGAIVLMHDGPAEREQTAEALPLILAGLKARGLTPVTIPQLLQDGHFPGVVVKTPPAQPGPAPTPLPVTPSPTLALVGDSPRR